MVKGVWWWWLCIVAAAVAAAAAGAPLQASPVNLLKYAYNNNGQGQYSFEFETSDGTYRREDGGLASSEGSLIVRGEYWFTDPGGRRHTVQYIADKNGFQPQQPDSDDVRFNDRLLVRK